MSRNINTQVAPLQINKCVRGTHLCLGCSSGDTNEAEAEKVPGTHACDDPQQCNKAERGTHDNATMRRVAPMAILGVVMQ